MLKRCLDALGTWVGITIAIGLVCATCLGAALYFKAGADGLLESQRRFEQRQLRNGFVAVSDLQRLILVAQQAALQGDLTETLATDFAAALDMLYVRAEALKSREQAVLVATTAPTASRKLFEIVDLADAALKEGFPDPVGFLVELNRESETARSMLVTFLDRARQLEDTVLGQQSEKLVLQTKALWIVFSALAIVGSTAMLLLRSEVVERQARTKAERRADFLAFFDPLTELPNRVQFRDRVEALLKIQSPIALFFIDLDNFKAINDTYGHSAGDRVLQVIGRRLGDVAGQAGGFAARLSGDEFAACLPTDRATQLAFFADGLLETMQQPIIHEGEDVVPGGSVGVATARDVAKDMSPTYRNLARVADFARSVSKEAGGNHFTIYDEALEERFSERRALAEELPRAIKSCELDVFFQPKVHLPAGEVYGFEALVRWSPNGKPVHPEQLIALAEDSGLVVEIDTFMLHHAVDAVARTNARLGTSFSVSVNLSALHFNGTRIIREVSNALEAADLAPHLLTLEVTETVQIKDWDRVQTILGGLRDLGCKISVDDFGSGYSSLVYLRKMMADEIKIDRSLVDEITTSVEARFVFTAIVDLSAALGMNVVVEGIEDRAQAETVHQMGCSQAQGYFFGRPTPCEDALRTATRGGRGNLRAVS